MPALLLCELPAAAIEAQSRILDKVTVLAVTGEAAVRFRAIEDVSGQPSRTLLAIEISSTDLARTLREDCRTDAALPTSLKMRLLHLAAAPGGIPIAAQFP